MCLDKQLVELSSVALGGISHLLCYLSVRGLSCLVFSGLILFQESCKLRCGEAPDDMFQPGAHPDHLDESIVLPVYADW